MKINVIKFETINGKKVGKAFSFPMDAKKMARYKTEATVRKKVEEYVAKSGLFKKNELNELKYDMTDFLQEWKKQKPIVEAEMLKELEASTNAGNRITPEHINRLGTNEVFVFGSNARGLHHGGAAKVAVESFGAVMGQGHGLQGKSYCGIAGFSPNDVAPLFKKCAILNNVSLPRSFWQIIGYPKE